MVKKLNKEGRKKLSKADGWSSSQLFHKIEDGKNRFRIMPFTDGEHLERVPSVLVGKHYWGGKAYICPQVTATSGEQLPCPICALVAKLRRLDDDEGFQKAVGEVSVRKRYWILAIKRGEKKPEVKILDAPGAVQDEITEKVVDEGLDVGDPYEGIDLTIKRSGKHVMTRYATDFVTDADDELFSSPLAKTEKEIKRLIKAAAKINIDEETKVDMDNLHIIAQAIEDALSVVPSDSYNDIEDEADEYVPKKKKKKKRTVVEDEEDDDEEDDDEEDEEDEEDEDDDEEEEVEEIKKPAKKSSRSKKANAASTQKKVAKRTKRKK